MAISAVFTDGAICASPTHSRLAHLNTAISRPSADSTRAGCSSRALRMSLMPGVNGIRIRL